MLDVKDRKLRSPKFRKYINQMKEYSLAKSLIHYLILYYRYPDPFFERMKFYKYHNKYGDLIDNMEDFLYTGLKLVVPSSLL